MDSPFSPHSPQSQIIATLFGSYLYLAAAIFLIVATLVVYSLVRYRAREGASEPRQTFGSRPLETAWTLIPLVTVAVLFIVTVRAMARIDAPENADRPPDLVVTGHQWWWEARYANGAVAAGEIHIPEGRRLLVRVESADVIHDFWVPRLARKMDAVPGRAGYIWLEADRPGSYAGTCSEFCGMQHAGMHFVVIAESEPNFSAWLAHQAAPARVASGGLPAEGARIFIERKCGDCHAISGSSANGTSGPPLTHVASQEFLGSDTSKNSPQNLALWLTRPQSMKPGNRMPDQRLSPGDVRALAAYMGSLQ